ncbi:PTS transporter subunit EIIC [Streptomyces sp. NBC_01754]|uniref:PTS transporter subunit EIIC n=1 Tax=Streptomyces sp. NBC_01754 TaxID=2975930 RepID=UPI002DD8B417|nr:PTS transporter subunit EIIC [Streptomyces sp. NBC_01754]WSC94093.1 PTS transporter subunit EIIC [Streptomyces sp. NBC_01754]
MATEDKNRATAAAILPLVGGAANVGSIAHCMTRLRLGLRDRSLVDDEALKALPSVMGVVEDDTYQIVLGPGTVARVTPEFERLVEEGRDSAPGPAPTDTAPDASAAAAVSAQEPAAQGAAIKAEQKAKNATPFKLFLRRIADIFVPLIPALIGCGIIAGLNGLLVNLGRLPAVTPALAAMASGFMALIAVFVGYNTAKEFGGTPILGGAVAAIIVFPGVANIDAFGQTLAPGQGGVLGALGAAVLAVYVERWCRRWVPEALDVLVTPTLTVLVSGLVTIFGLMYVAGEVSSAIGTFADRLLSTGGAGAGFLLGGFFLPLVMLGLHQALIPIHTTLIEQQGFTVLLPILAMAGAGQVGAAAAVYLRLPRNESIRKTIRSAMPAGLLGVGEPLIYGVSLPLGRPFVTACVGGAFGGGFVGLFNQLGDSVGSTAIGPSGWALFPLLDGNHGLGTTVAIYGGGLLAGYVAGFVATYFFGFSASLLEEFNASQEPAPAAAPVTDGPASGSGRTGETGETGETGGPDDSGGSGGSGGSGSSSGSGDTGDSGGSPAKEPAGV